MKETPNDETGIVLSNFSKSYGKIAAVDSVSFTACKGNATCLLGANGAGKTTILKAICAVHYPSSGFISVNGINTFDNPCKVKQLIGLVSEQPSLYPEYTVNEFLSFIAKIRLATEKKHSYIEIRQSIEKVSEICSLSNSILKTKINKLSKGYRQRVSFASAFISDPPVLVLDEPTSGLDPLQIKQMRSIILEAAKSKTVLVSTHIMQEAEALAGNIHIIQEGHLVASGSLNEILRINGAKNLEDAFLKAIQTENEK